MLSPSPSTHPDDDHSSETRSLSSSWNDDVIWAEHQRRCRDELERAADECADIKREIQMFCQSHLQFKERKCHFQIDAIESQLNHLQQQLSETIIAVEASERDVMECRRCLDYLSALSSLIIPRLSHAVQNTSSTSSSMASSLAFTQLATNVNTPNPVWLSSLSSIPNPLLLDATHIPQFMQMPRLTPSGGTVQMKEFDFLYPSPPQIHQNQSKSGSTLLLSSQSQVSRRISLTDSSSSMQQHPALSTTSDPPRSSASSTRSSSSIPTNEFPMPPMPPLDPFALFANPSTALLSPFQVIAYLANSSVLNSSQSPLLNPHFSSVKQHPSSKSNLMISPLLPSSQSPTLSAAPTSFFSWFAGSAQETKQLTDLPLPPIAASSISSSASSSNSLSRRDPGTPSFQSPTSSLLSAQMQTLLNHLPPELTLTAPLLSQNRSPALSSQNAASKLCFPSNASSHSSATEINEISAAASANSSNLISTPQSIRAINKSTPASSSKTVLSSLQNSNISRNPLSNFTPARSRSGTVSSAQMSVMPNSYFAIAYNFSVPHTMEAPTPYQLHSRWLHWGDEQLDDEHQESEAQEVLELDSSVSGFQTSVQSKVSLTSSSSSSNLLLASRGSRPSSRSASPRPSTPRRVALPPGSPSPASGGAGELSTASGFGSRSSTPIRSRFRQLTFADQFESPRRFRSNYQAGSPATHVDSQSGAISPSFGSPLSSLSPRRLGISQRRLSDESDYEDSNENDGERGVFKPSRMGRGGFGTGRMSPLPSSSSKSILGHLPPPPLLNQQIVQFQCNPLQSSNGHPVSQHTQSAELNSTSPISLFASHSHNNQTASNPSSRANPSSRNDQVESHSLFRFGDNKLQINSDHFGTKQSSSIFSPTQIHSSASSSSSKPISSQVNTSTSMYGFASVFSPEFTSSSIAASLKERFAVRRLRETLVKIGGPKYLPLLQPPSIAQIVSKSSLTQSVAESAEEKTKSEEKHLRELLHHYQDWRWCLFFTSQQLCEASQIFYHDVFSMCWTQLLSNRKKRHQLHTTIEVLLHERERIRLQSVELRTLNRLLMIEIRSNLPSSPKPNDSKIIWSQPIPTAVMNPNENSQLPAAKCEIEFSDPLITTAYAQLITTIDNSLDLDQFADLARFSGDEIAHSQRLLQALDSSRAYREQCWHLLEMELERDLLRRNLELEAAAAKSSSRASSQ